MLYLYLQFLRLRIWLLRRRLRRMGLLEPKSQVQIQILPSKSKAYFDEQKWIRFWIWLWLVWLVLAVIAMLSLLSWFYEPIRIIVTPAGKPAEFPAPRDCNKIPTLPPTAYDH